MVTLDDKVAKVAKYVPQWQNDPRKSKITLRHLGSHTSGLDDSRPNEEAKWKDDFWKRVAPPNDPFTISRDITPLQRACANDGIDRAAVSMQPTARRHLCGCCDVCGSLGRACSRGAAAL
jgi:hypothetical protein